MWTDFIIFIGFILSIFIIILRNSANIFKSTPYSAYPTWKTIFSSLRNIIPSLKNTWKYQPKKKFYEEGFADEPDEEEKDNKSLRR